MISKLLAIITLCRAYALIRWWEVYVPARLRCIGVRLGKNIRFKGMPIVSMYDGSSILIDENCVICSVSEMTALGVCHPVVLRTLRAEASIKIGKDSGISGGTLCAATSIKIGCSCLIGANVTIADTDFHSISPINRRQNDNQDAIGTSPVCIEDNVFIGASAIILKGVHIGKNSIIGAGSVVSSNVPANVIAAGNPAKVLRSIL